jgi:hypothetical protein
VRKVVINRSKLIDFDKYVGFVQLDKKGKLIIWYFGTELPTYIAKIRKRR